MDPELAIKVLKEKLLANPPFGAEVKLEIMGNASGFNGNKLSDKLSGILKNSSEYLWNNVPQFNGEGGSIGMMNIFK